MDKMKEGFNEYRRKLENGEIEKPQKMDPIEKAAANPKSLRAAINAKCFDCSCRQRREVTLCTVNSCPLFKIRPWQAKNEN